MAIKILFTLSFCLQILSGYGQKPTFSKQRKTTNYAFFNSAHNVHLVFDKTYKPSVLTKQQLFALQAMIRRVSDSLNLVVTSTNVDTQKTDTLFHKFQIVSAQDSKGEIKVWVHAVCDPDTEWRKMLFFADDGGNCYYNFKVNLTQGKYYNIAFY